MIRCDSYFEVSENISVLDWHFKAKPTMGPVPGTRHNLNHMSKSRSEAVTLMLSSRFPLVLFHLLLSS